MAEIGQDWSQYRDEFSEFIERLVLRDYASNVRI